MSMPGIAKNYLVVSSIKVLLKILVNGWLERGGVEELFIRKIANKGSNQINNSEVGRRISC